MELRLAEQEALTLYRIILRWAIGELEAIRGREAAV